jgi:phosphoenolpyruvate carboxykinase (GTP)
VNWFRRNAEGGFAWPGFGDNMRVLAWIVERCRGRARGMASPLGTAPTRDDLDWRGSTFLAAAFADVMRLDTAEWRAELAAHDALFARVGPKVPAVLVAERRRLGDRLR